MPTPQPLPPHEIVVPHASRIVVVEGDDAVQLAVAILSGWFLHPSSATLPH